MKPVKIMINGLPGNVAANVANHAIEDNRFELIRHSLTGPEISEKSFRVKDVEINLVRPEKRDGAVSEIMKNGAPFICVDYTCPSAVIENAKFYCGHKIPFVMGTTGGDRKLLEQIVLSSSVAAVISPNMAKQIVGFQAMMEYAAETFPGLFKGYSLAIRESHQKGKADTSGTAKVMVGYFNRLGMPFEEDEIEKVRDPVVQEKDLEVPKKYLAGHGWHNYSLVSNDKTVSFLFSHNINGRDVYVEGTLDAVIFLREMVAKSEQGRVFSMIDVLKNNA